MDRIRCLTQSIVTDLHYYGGVTDTLLVGTLGRGAWAIPNAAAAIAAPSVLTIQGGTGNDIIFMQLKNNEPWLLETFVNGVAQALVPIESLPKRYRGGKANDTLIVDMTNGFIELGNGLDGFTFDGEHGTNTLVLQGPGKGTDSGPLGEFSFMGNFDQFSGTPGSYQRFHYKNATAQNLIGSPLEFGTKRLNHLGQAMQRVADHFAVFGSEALFGQAIPVIGNSLGLALNDDSHLIRRLIEEGLGSFSLSDVHETGSINTAQLLRDRFDALDAIPNNVTLTETATSTKYDLQIVKSVSGTADLAIDNLILGGSVALDGTVEISADIALHLIFGVDATSGDLFIEPLSGTTPEIVVTNLRVNRKTSGTGQIGFLGVDVNNASLVFGPDVRISLKFKDPGTLAADNRIQLPESDGIPPSWRRCRFKAIQRPSMSPSRLMWLYRCLASDLPTSIWAMLR